MPKMSNIEIVMKNEQPVLSIRTRTKVNELPMLIGEGYEKLSAYLAELGEMLADVPFVAYHNMDMQDLDVEIGFQVAKPLPGRGEIQSSAIPGGKMILCMYRGPYHEMEPMYNEMTDWIQQNGYQPAGTVYEYYYNGPEFPESELLTMVVMPVK